MHALIGFSLVLALLEGYDDHNGFDPTSVVLLNEAGQFVVDGTRSGEFRDWLRADPEVRAEVVAFFIRCALDEKTEIRFKDSRPPVHEYAWRGALGLAANLQSTVGGLRPLKLAEPAGTTPADKHKDKDKDKDNKHEDKDREMVEGSRAHVVLTGDEGKWVSACLMAHANRARSHQYISTRGNPPGAAGERLRPSPGERWTMGYPEGVFFADVLNFNVRSTDGQLRIREHRKPPSAKDLEQSFTLSLDLPGDYPGLPPASWAPPNASNGRTLDFQEVTTAGPSPNGTYRVAQKLGTYLATRELFTGPQAPTDPDYASDAVCVKDRAVVACDSAGAVLLRPLFVHSPRVVGLASATNEVDATLTIQAVDAGPTWLVGGQKLDCTAGRTCTGPFRLTAAGEPPVAPPAGKPHVLAGLGEGQSVLAVLRFDSEKEHYQLDMDEPFTAIVRYRSSGDASARIEVSDRAGAWREASPRSWPSTEAKAKARASDPWEWMQVYPAYAFKDPGEEGHGRPALKIKISGSGDGKHAPILDLAGFVSGPPWCHPDPAGTFAGVCADPGGVSMLRRAAWRAEPPSR